MSTTPGSENASARRMLAVAGRGEQGQAADEALGALGDRRGDGAAERVPDEHARVDAQAG